MIAFQILSLSLNIFAQGKICILCLLICSVSKYLFYSDLVFISFCSLLFHICSFLIFPFKISNLLVTIISIIVIIIIIISFNFLPILICGKYVYFLNSEYQTEKLKIKSTLLLAPFLIKHMFTA